MLKDKTVLITGATRGIGKEVALSMAKNGADIAALYSSDVAAAEELKKLVENMGVRCQVYKCNVSDFENSKTTAETVIKDFGHIDILVNNAGITRDGLVASMSEADFDIVLDVNLKGAFNMIKHLYQNFMRLRGGTIINMSSIIGLSGGAGQANYAASKGGLIALTKSVAKELAGRGVTCNAIAPGYIETEMTEVLSDAVKQKYLTAIPLRRAGKPSDIAALAIFLASEGARYITGEVIRADGGLCI